MIKKYKTLAQTYKFPLHQYPISFTFQQDKVSPSVLQYCKKYESYLKFMKNHEPDKENLF